MVSPQRDLNHNEVRRSQPRLFPWSRFGSRFPTFGRPRANATPCRSCSPQPALPACAATGATARSPNGGAATAAPDGPNGRGQPGRLPDDRQGEPAATAGRYRDLIPRTAGRDRDLDAGQNYRKWYGRIDERCLTASSALVGYIDWPGHQQVFSLERTITIKKNGAQRQEVFYGITSLSLQRADAARLLRLNRRHWRIEAARWKRDVIFDEDRPQIPVATSLKSWTPCVMSESPAPTHGRRNRYRRCLSPARSSALGCSRHHRHHARELNGPGHTWHRAWDNSGKRVAICCAMLERTRPVEVDVARTRRPA